jgi:predicted RNase H-like nuclease (RuvC/YqgF family)
MLVFGHADSNEPVKPSCDGTDIRKDVPASEDDTSELEDGLQKYKQVNDSLIKKAVDMRTRLKVAKAAKNSMENDLANLSYRYSTLAAENATLGDSLGDSQAALEASQGALAAANAELTAQIATLEASQAALASLEVSYDAVASASAELAAQVNELAARNATLEAEVENLRARNTSLGNNNRNLGRQAAVAVAAQTQLTLELSTEESRYALLDVSYTELEQECDDLQSRVVELQRSNDIYSGAAVDQQSNEELCGTIGLLNGSLAVYTDALKVRLAAVTLNATSHYSLSECNICLDNNAPEHVCIVCGNGVCAACRARLLVCPYCNANPINTVNMRGIVQLV